MRCSFPLSSAIFIIIYARPLTAFCSHVSAFTINKSPSNSQILKPKSQLMLARKKVGRTPESMFQHHSSSTGQSNSQRVSFPRRVSLKRKTRKLLFTTALSVSMFLRGLRLPVSASHTKGTSEAITEPKSKGFSKNAAPIIAAAGGVVLAKKIQSKKYDSENINRNKGRKNLVRVLPEQEDETRSATENSQHEAEARKVANACKDVAQLKREEEERLAAEEAARLKREEEERLAAEEAARLEREEEERLAVEEAARLKREEEERLAAEEAARLKREEEERLATEEAARLKREEEERLAAEEAARLKREEEERLAAEEAARLKREEEERLAVEEAARLKREEEERLAVEEAAHNPEDKYLAIEDPSERAYQILIDLGMVQVTPDPDDPSYDSSKDDEYVV